ncbi:MAG: hypothetical protein ABFS12_08020 [Bacteroidota bacterium]
MKIKRINILMVSLLFTSAVYSQVNQKNYVNNDSLENSSSELLPPNSLSRDWRLLNYPLLPNYTTNCFYESSFFLTFNTTNTQNNFLVSKEEMLAQFRLQQNWNTKKSFSSFAEYLGYAQFLGAIGLLGVHISQWSNLKNTPPSSTPTNSFNRYDFKK